MSRYMIDVVTNRDPEQVVHSAEDFLIREGFEKVIYKGEEVWQKGKGFTLGPQFIKIDPHPGLVHIEAWITMALLPGVFVGEMDTGGGFIGGLPKKRLRDRVVRLEASLN